jgi:GT2 family glycosyltransferase
MSALDSALDDKLAQYLCRLLDPQRVLDVGESPSPLARGMQSQGVEISFAKSVRDPIRGPYDLILCADPPGLTSPAAAGDAVGSLARGTDAVCYRTSADDESREAEWVRIFRELGFSRDPLLTHGGLPTGWVLLRRIPAANPALAEILRLRKEVATLRSAVADLHEMQTSTADRLEGHIGQLRAQAGQAAHEVQNILNSRVWNTLVAAGGWILRANELIHGRTRHSGQWPLRTADKVEPVFHVVCDEPAGGKATAVSGSLLFRGWAVASSGIDRMEIQPSGQDAVQARFGLYRPDIARLHPGIPDGDRSGFQVHLDTTRLPLGPVSVAVRAISKKGARLETEVQLLVDHVHGYVSDYYRWIAEFEKRDLPLIRMRLDSFPVQPLISVLVPVYRTAPEILEKTIGSVLAQTYSNWELCLVDDSSHSEAVDRIFARYAAADRRIKTARLDENGGISRASNRALELATGEYIALLDHDDELAADALYHVVQAINRHPDADIFYSDEDHIDESGFRSDPFFKPDWSPDLILSENYVTHLMVFQASLAKAVGGFRSECDLSQDHDILLRMSLKARKIIHIPRILYHWRTNVFAIDRASNAYDKALATSRRAVVDYLKLAGVQAEVDPGAVSGRWRVRYAIPENTWVDCIVPCGGNVDLLERCLDSLACRTEYPLYRLTIVDNSRGTAVEKLVRGWSKEGHNAKYVDWRNRRFNFSAMNNDAARTCSSPLLLFLNDDMTVLTPGWLTAMVELAARPQVGAVGAKLLYPDSRIQHAGVTIGLLGICGHGFKGAFDDQRTYFDFPDVIRNVSAVTGACMMTPAKLFWDAGGFDQEDFPVAYQDVDYCLKLHEKGYRVLYTPHAKLYHYEAFSKREEDKDPNPEETTAFQAKWQRYIESDPFYSPNLTRCGEDYSLRKKESGLASG